MSKKPRVRVRQFKGGLFIKNTQVALHEPGYWLNGKWQPDIGERMESFNKLKDWLYKGEWYENFWNKNELSKRRGGMVYRTNKPRVKPELKL